MNTSAAEGDATGSAIGPSLILTVKKPGWKCTRAAPLDRWTVRRVPSDRSGRGHRRTERFAGRGALRTVATEATTPAPSRAGVVVRARTELPSGRSARRATPGCVSGAVRARRLVRDRNGPP